MALCVKIQCDSCSRFPWTDQWLSQHCISILDLCVLKAGKGPTAANKDERLIPRCKIRTNPVSHICKFFYSVLFPLAWMGKLLHWSNRKAFPHLNSLPIYSSWHHGDWQDKWMALGTMKQKICHRPRTNQNSLIPSMTINIDQDLDIPYFQFCCHLIPKISSLPLLQYYPSIKVDTALFRRPSFKRNYLLDNKIKPPLAFLCEYPSITPGLLIAKNHHVL